MKTLRRIVFASLSALTTPLLAQEGHQHHGGAAAEAPAPTLAEIAPASDSKGSCEKSKKNGHG